MQNSLPYVILLGLVLGVIVALGSSNSDSVNNVEGPPVVEATVDSEDDMTIEVVAEPAETDLPVDADSDADTDAD